jgi:hypothetical protein
MDVLGCVHGVNLLLLLLFVIVMLNCQGGLG